MLLCHLDQQFIISLANHQRLQNIQFRKKVLIFPLYFTLIPKEELKSAPGSVIYARNKLILPWPNLTINLDLLEEKGSEGIKHIIEGIKEIKKVTKMKWYYWVILAGLLVVAITVILMMGMNTQNV